MRTRPWGGRAHLGVGNQVQDEKPVASKGIRFCPENQAPHNDATADDFDPYQYPILARYWPDLIPEPPAVVTTSVAASDASARQA